MELQHLVLVGHGSALAGHTAATLDPVLCELRDRQGFTSAVGAFVNTRPTLGQALMQLGPAGATVVPMLGEDGRYARSVAVEVDNAVRAGGDVRMTPVLGLHRPFITALAGRVLDMLDDASVSRAGAGLLVIGHGCKTEHRPGAASLLAAALHSAFDETATIAVSRAPTLADWTSLFRADEIVAVPMLFSHGRHRRVDVTHAIGASPDAVGQAPVSGPFRSGDKRLWLVEPLADAAFLGRAIAALARDVALPAAD